MPARQKGSHPRVAAERRRVVAELHAGIREALDLRDPAPRKRDTGGLTDALLMALHAYDRDGEGIVWPAIDTLADDVGVSVDRLRYGLGLLVDRGDLRIVERRYGRKRGWLHNVYELLVPPPRPIPARQVRRILSRAEARERIRKHRQRHRRFEMCRNSDFENLDEYEQLLLSVSREKPRAPARREKKIGRPPDLIQRTWREWHELDLVTAKHLNQKYGTPRLAALARLRGDRRAGIPVRVTMRALTAGE